MAHVQKKEKSRGDDPIKLIKIKNWTAHQLL